MMFPMMFSPILVGFQFKFMFNDNIGLVNNALQALGLTDHAIPWLIEGTLAFIAILVAEIWSSTSVFAILILAGLLAMPREPIEAARVDGCTPWQTFRYVTWPFVMPFAFIAMTIRSLDVARAYDIVKIMTDGGPAGRTELLWTLLAAQPTATRDGPGPPRCRPESGAAGRGRPPQRLPLRAAVQSGHRGAAAPVRHRAPRRAGAAAPAPPPGPRPFRDRGARRILGSEPILPALQAPRRRHAATIPHIRKNHIKDRKPRQETGPRVL